MKKKMSVKCFILSLLLVALPATAVVMLIKNSAGMVVSLSGKEKLRDIFSQLKSAHVMPPVLVCVIIAAILGITLSLSRQNRALFITNIVLSLLLTLAFCALFTKVNSIPIHTIVGILANILKSGVL
ncbi:MAG: hypothetical protein GX633_04400 [Clostridiales bacterium]|jgi:hypothetical protein|nr:hypothetical protein [Clostridiales bacterium]